MTDQMEQLMHQTGLLAGIVWAWTAINLLPAAPAYAQESIVFERASDAIGNSELVRQVVFTGKRWRNVLSLSMKRGYRVRGARDYYLRPMVLDAYYACGSTNIMMPSRLEQIGPQSKPSYDVDAPETLITVGINVPLQSPKILGLLEPSEGAALAAALAPICRSSKSDVSGEPTNLVLSAPEDFVEHLLPSRFDRQGDIVRAWGERLYTKSINIESSGRREERPALDKNRGTAKLQVEWDCKRGQSRIVRSLEYDLNGRVVSSYGARDSWEEVVPGSVGESALQTICDIK